MQFWLRLINYQTYHIWFLYKMDPFFFIKSAKNGIFFINMNILINGRIYTPARVSSSPIFASESEVWKEFQGAQELSSSHFHNTIRSTGTMSTFIFIIGFSILVIMGRESDLERWQCGPSAVKYPAILPRPTSWIKNPWPTNQPYCLPSIKLGL